MLIILIFLIISNCFAVKWIDSNASSDMKKGTEIVMNHTDALTREISTIDQSKQESPELIFVHTLWRHGDRGPLIIYPNDPYNETVWPNGIGELTEIGIRQLFQVGKRFYQQYINSTSPFLSKNYYNKEIYIRSTDVNRTITSAMAVLAGMFPNGIAGKDYPKESDEVNWPRGWIPIPIHTIELKHDHTGNPFYHCIRAELLENEGYESNVFRETIAKYKDLLAYLSNMTGYQNLQPNDSFNFIFDALIVERFHNLKLPEWFTKEIEEQMKALYTEIRKYRFGNAKYFGSSGRLIRLRGGAILNGIIDKLQQKWECLNDNSSKCIWYKRIKFYGLSAHDVTISALLVALGINSQNMDIYHPQYGATVFFELYRFNNQPYVKFLYSNIYSDEPQSITHFIRGCPLTSDLCPLEEFIIAQKDHLPATDIEKECHEKM
ncbi:Uncharacterized protein BM_BM8502 [Brugia malayi]|uniref:Histidine acid phosphatase family protein n=2 Tax=Brugia malayi TaxID=6279 RepID=A0A4E9FXX7_BRUMA|nr:Uncharacterized protein BM_BM8502 [Brugia malayi]VIO99423.1 Uncharacterized protein BM_BM8502 [Brugia malayi]